jgi:putative urate catabolism protein
VRDHVGYGQVPPSVTWPGGARLAVQFALNYEEGGELSPLNGDETSEPFMNEVPLPALVGQRNTTSESLYDYGSRVGFWRILRMFEERKLPMTAYAVGRALELNPDVGVALAERGHEVAGHGYRWIDYRNIPEDVERANIATTYDLIKGITGMPPVGWFTGRISPNTRRLVAEHGGFTYDSDAYDDDLPYWVKVGGKPHLVIPYTFDANDMKFATVPPHMTSNDEFTRYLIDGFDVLYAEGATSPKMMSVGLHCRIAGRPGRAKALERFLDYVCSFDDVWVCTRAQIAERWNANHGPEPDSLDGRASVPV